MAVDHFSESKKGKSSRFLPHFFDIFKKFEIFEPKNFKNEIFWIFGLKNWEILSSKISKILKIFEIFGLKNFLKF